MKSSLYTEEYLVKHREWNAKCREKMKQDPERYSKFLLNSRMHRLSKLSAEDLHLYFYKLDLKKPEKAENDRKSLHEYMEARNARNCQKCTN